MAVYGGAIEDISSKQIDFVTAVLEKHGFGDAKVTVKPVGAAGDNYAANVKRFVAERDGKTFKMIGKVAPVVGQMRQAGSTVELFHNEYIMYSSVLPKFTELEITAGIPEEDRLRYAKFYGAFMEEPHELILLEDLQEPGFVILDRFKSLNNETVRLILKNFARLHALSYVLKIKEPEMFATFKSRLRDPWKAMSKDENNKYFFGILDNDTCGLIEFERHRNAVKGKIIKLFEMSEDLSKVDYDSRHSVIQQGDSWTNNIMFIMEEDKPVHCCMIDYQLSRVNSPVADILYMIFNCTDYKTRYQHYRDWIDYYHLRLEKELFEFGLSVDYWYPRVRLDEDLKRHAESILGITVMAASMLTRQSEDAAKIQEAMKTEVKDGNVDELVEAIRVTELDSGTKHLFTKKIEGAVETMFELGYL